MARPRCPDAVDKKEMAIWLQDAPDLDERLRPRGIFQVMRDTLHEDDVDGIVCEGKFGCVTDQTPDAPPEASNQRPGDLGRH